MHIIIDGYNLIRQSETLRRHERQSLEAGRRALIHRVALYRTYRDHRVTIIFDGRESDSPEEERDVQNGILIIYSRRGETADDVIKRLVLKKEEETIVVTSDRNLADYISRRGGIAVPSADFETRIEAVRTPAPVSGRDEDEQDGAGSAKGARKKGPPRRMSRREKAALARIKKL